jgi:hypothetical protein
MATCAVILPATDFDPAASFQVSSSQSSTRSVPPQTSATSVARSSLARRDPREFGTSWIGTSIEFGPLRLSQANVQGLRVIDGFVADGWLLRFNRGELNAWQSDWNQHDDSYVDSVDLVFYTGHANGMGWILSALDDTFLDVTGVSGPQDRWGAQD